MVQIQTSKKCSVAYNNSFRIGHKLPHYSAVLWVSNFQKKALRNTLMPPHVDILCNELRIHLKLFFVGILKSQVVSLQTAHSWANAGVLLGDACIGSGVAFEAI